VPRLKPETLLARQERILDAAESCFARTGFHRTTMQDICKQADVSPGALYVYFKSKEDLIAGLCARERAVFDEKIKALQDAPDFLGALEKIAQHYFVEQSAEKRLVGIEMGVEGTRNPKVADICLALESNVAAAFLALFQRLKDNGRIAPDLGIQEVTDIFMIMGDGLFWRRAVVPGFDANKVLPSMMRTLHDLLKPVPVDVPKSANRTATYVKSGVGASKIARKSLSDKSPDRKTTEVAS
jgi:TetR/AcrR family transcriptional regulator, repressor for uid operon